MNAEQRRDRRLYPTIKARVAQAFYEHGRFCAAHPILCLSMTICFFVLLALPTVSRFRLPISSPMDVHWSTGIPEPNTGPEWLQLSPAAYLQQIVIRSGVEPWHAANLSVEQSIRGPLSRAFIAMEKLRMVPELSAICLQIQNNGELGIPRRGCLLTSPSLFWHDDVERMREDENVVSTVYAANCSPELCVRDLLLGMPAGMSGVKQRFQTNRKRTIDFAVTLFLHQYDEHTIQKMASSLETAFSRVESEAQDDTTFVHVFYRPRKYFTDYFPLILSYTIFGAYLYYSASKFEMVSSRAGLALAAAFTIAATLMITAGVSAYLDLQPSLWGADLFPYLALIVSLENVLCITKAVVYTPPSLDVASRIAHGLSHEGYTIAKYFLLELIFLSAGFITGVVEIQQFCQFAFVGLVTDFFMQLFFYIPCLVLDLHRLSDDEKKRFSLLLLTIKVPPLGTFPTVNCPVKRLWPSLFEKARKKRLTRALSESRLNGLWAVDHGNSVTKKGLPSHRRSASTAKQPDFDDNDKPLMGRMVSARRLGFMSFISRTRLFQRTLMVLFALWVIWLGFIVQRRLPDDAADASRFGVSQRLLETAPQQWGEWQRRTFKWWPALFAEYNMTLSGHYITYLPPIVLKTMIAPDDPMLFAVPPRPTIADTAGGRGGEQAEDPPKELRSRIEWLERQLRVYMAICALCVLTIVILFLSYACFWGQWRNGWRGIEGPQPDLSPSPTSRPKSGLIELGYTKLKDHRFPIEFVKAGGPGQSLLCTVCQGGRVILWDEKLDENRREMARNRFDPLGKETTDDARRRGDSINGTPRAQNGHELPAVWTVDANEKILVLGCADGSLEIGSFQRAKLLAVYLENKSGIVQMKIRGSLIALARLDGSVEVLRVDFSEGEPLRIRSVRQLGHSPAHQSPMTVLEMGDALFATASHDHSVKLWDNRTCRGLQHLQFHKAPVTSLLIDESEDVIFSACEEGVVCWWRMTTGKLIRSTEDPFGYAVELAATGENLLGLGADGQLSVWDRPSGQLITRMGTHPPQGGGSPLLEKRFIVTIETGVVVTAQHRTISFWDLGYKALVKEVEVEQPLDGLAICLGRTVFAPSGNIIYRIPVPVVHLK
ncbi:unnamed protein product, partial [Mesorhabditis spiculigera]